MDTYIFDVVFFNRDTHDEIHHKFEIHSDKYSTAWVQVAQRASAGKTLLDQIGIDSIQLLEVY